MGPCNHFQLKGRNNQRETLKCLEITNLPMSSRNQGLTVGELTMAIAALILISLVWSGIVNNRDENANSFKSSTLGKEIEKIY